MEWSKVGLSSIDSRHEEFVELVEMLKSERNDEVFILIFERMISHSREHFAAEEADMQKISSTNIYEHKQEHKKALEEMEYFYTKAKSGKLFFAKNYINDRVENWFRQHILNMDSDLARELTQKSQELLDAKPHSA